MLPDKGREPTLAELVSAVASDARDLLRQEVALARHELHVEMGKAKTAIVSLGAAAMVLLLGLVLLSIMAVHLLQLATGMPLWGAYGIVAGVCVLVGSVLLVIGRQRAASIDALADTIQTTKENVQWIKQNATSDTTWNEHAPR